jgi:hypothetical protein
MGKKYEVFYFDSLLDKEFVEINTDSIIKTLLLVRKLKKQWHCVGIRIRKVV